jgi:hypothetical protein
MNSGKSNPLEPFSIKEKISAQFTFNAGALTGAYGLYLESPTLGVAYFLYAYIGILSLMRYTVCPRCPHLQVANDCVQLPSSMVKRIISSKREGPLNLPEKALFVVVLYGILILPIYWLASNLMILALFLLFYGGSILGLHLHFCRNCRNKVCIQNRNRQLD